MNKFTESGRLLVCWISFHLEPSWRASVSYDRQEMMDEQQQVIRA